MSRNPLSGPVLLLMLLVGLAGCGSGGEGDATSANGTGAADAQPLEISGKKIYGEYCFSCHGPGLNGAPKLGDKEAWAPRLAKGVDLMLQATIDGIPPAMPPMGLCMSCSNEELRAAVEYMSTQ